MRDSEENERVRKEELDEKGIVDGELKRKREKVREDKIVKKEGKRERER